MFTGDFSGMQVGAVGVTLRAQLGARMTATMVAMEWGMGVSSCSVVRCLLEKSMGGSRDEYVRGVAEFQKLCGSDT